MVLCEAVWSLSWHQMASPGGARSNSARSASTSLDLFSNCGRIRPPMCFRSAEEKAKVKARKVKARERKANMKREKEIDQIPTVHPNEVHHKQTARSAAIISKADVARVLIAPTYISQCADSPRPKEAVRTATIVTTLTTRRPPSPRTRRIRDPTTTGKALPPPQEDGRTLAAAGNGSTLRLTQAQLQCAYLLTRPQLWPMHQNNYPSKAP